MTIRAKLLIFIPLLVVFANTVAFFVFQSGKVVQRSYDEMLGRILLIEQNTESADTNLKLLYAFLLDPRTDQAEMNSAGGQLERLSGEIRQEGNQRDASFTLEDYVNLTATFLEQKQAAIQASASEQPQIAFNHYVEAESTAGYIREEGQRLVDAELAFYRPIINNIREENERMNRLGAVLFGLNALMGLLFAVWASRSITGPVGRLVRLAKQIATGNLDIAPQPRRDDELGILSGAIQQMSADLSVLIERDKKSLEMQRLVKELELQALQSQINPHFLFNTLNVLSRLALLEGADKTSDLIISMSNLLRYSLQRLDTPVTLQEEITHIKEYAAIQQARFRERIRFELDADPAVLQVEIPALTLQPLVENAYHHGVANMESGAVISLKVLKAETGVLIEISDNGAGIPEETLQAIMRLEASSDSGKSTGLGTRNVLKRLQLFYGEDDLVQIRSGLGQGTTITIRIPAKEGDEQIHVQTADRG
ncbi:Sensor histidine kinase YpdA [compost metagenome]